MLPVGDVTLVSAFDFLGITSCNQNLPRFDLLYWDLIYPNTLHITFKRAIIVQLCVLII